MRKYRLFSEWREIGIWGEDLEDALMRLRIIRKPDLYHYEKIADGEELEITRIIKCDIPPYRRGDKDVVRAIAETTEGKILEIVAEVEEDEDA